MYKYLKTFIDYFLAFTILIIFSIINSNIFTILLFDRVNQFFTKLGLALIRKNLKFINLIQ